MTAPRIPTPAQWITEILGAIGSGPKDRTGILGKLVDHGYHYFHVEPALNGVLADMVASGRIERVENPSHYDPKQTWTAWRLPSSTPMESPAAPVAVPAGHISASDYRAQGGKRKGGRG